MDTSGSSAALLAGRPMLGAAAFAACFAGGTSAQNVTGMAHAVDRVTYADPWQPQVTAAEPAGGTASPRGTSAVLSTGLPGLAKVAEHKSAVRSPAPTPAPLPALMAPLAAAPVATAADAPAPAVQLASAASPAPVAASPALETTVPQVLTAPSDRPGPAAAITSASTFAAAIPAATSGAAPIAGEPLTEPAALISSPELRRFDLASFRKPAPKRSALASSRKAPAGTAKGAQTTRLIDDVVFHQASIAVGGQADGQITVRIGPDMKPSVKVADLLSLVSAQMDPDSLARFSLASSAGDYVSFAALRTAGFDVAYNAAADSIAITVAP